ncbi:MAG: hypothetical protein WDM88_06210 [Galbitalea sp.]
MRLLRARLASAAAKSRRQASRPEADTPTTIPPRERPEDAGITATLVALRPASRRLFDPKTCPRTKPVLSVPMTTISLSTAAAASAAMGSPVTVRTDTAIPGPIDCARANSSSRSARVSGSSVASSQACTRDHARPGLPRTPHTPEDGEVARGGTVDADRDHAWHSWSLSPGAEDIRPPMLPAAGRAGKGL